MPFFTTDIFREVKESFTTGDWEVGQAGGAGWWSNFNSLQLRWKQCARGLFALEFFTLMQENSLRVANLSKCLQKLFCKRKVKITQGNYKDIKHED